MTNLSPAAQAVLDAYFTHADLLNREVSSEEMLAAALRAAADQVVPEQRQTDEDAVLVDSLHLSTRTENALKRCRVFTVGDLKCFTYTDLLLIKGLGEGSVNEVVEALAGIGVSLLCSAQELKLGWANVTVRRTIRTELLAIAAELKAQQ